MPAVWPTGASTTNLQQADVFNTIVSPLDTFISFLVERARIEQTYSESLTRLHDKVGLSSLNEEGLDETLVVVWKAIRQSVRKEADVRRTYYQCLFSDIIKHLQVLASDLKIARNKTLESLMDNAGMKDSPAAAQESNIPLFKNQYFQRCREVQFNNTPENRREASRADQRYRAAVHSFETLRYRRMADIVSVEKTLSESQGVMKGMLKKYLTESISALRTQNSHLVDCSHSVVKAVPSGGASVLSNATSLSGIISTALKRSPQPIFYHNYFDGECPHLVFGIPLRDYAFCQNLGDDEVPSIVQICIEQVETKGSESTHIYRGSPSSPKEETFQLARSIEKDVAAFRIAVHGEDVDVISELLLYYLHELPEPLCLLTKDDRQRYPRDNNIAAKMAHIHTRLRHQPPVHRAVFTALLRHLHNLFLNHERNGQSLDILNKIFSPLIFGDPGKSSKGLFGKRKAEDTILADMIQNHDHIKAEIEALPLVNRASRSMSLLSPTSPSRPGTARSASSGYNS